MLKDIFETTLDDAQISLEVEGKPVRLTFASTKDREKFRWGLYNTIRNAREENKKLPADDPVWGKCQWDQIIVERDGDTGILLTLPQFCSYLPLKVETVDPTYVPDKTSWKADKDSKPNA